MMTDIIRNFKQKLHDDYVIGSFCKTSDPALIEIMGYSGFDFVIIDLEHGPNSVETVQNLIRAACVSDILPIIRVKENNLSVIGEVLDIGAGGFQVPQVSCVGDVDGIIQMAKFYPVGSRGICRFVRAAYYSAMDRFEYLQKANESLVIIQLESLKAISVLEDMLKIKAIDIIFIGPYDLSQSLGIPGQIDHPKVVEKMIEIVGICAKHQVYVGTFVDNINNAEKWKRAGVKYIAYQVDVGIFYEACSDIVKRVRGVLP